MPGTQRLLASLNNCVYQASASASAQRAATRTIYPQIVTRAGNGTVALTGAYSGPNDATFDVEIRPASGSAAKVTQPVLTGAGNGTMTQPTATSGTAAQTVTVTLVDLGTETTAAQAILYADLLLRARSTGTGGNSITLSITPNLTLSTTPVGALAEALARDTQEWSDQRLDFGSLPLNPDGTLSASCPRLIFGRDTSRVYRHYKRWDGEQWQYGVSPKLNAAYPAGAQVYAVTGNYTVVVTNGVTTESVSGTTLYQILLALSASTLIEVVGVIANDQRPGGQAAIDLPIRTSAFALPVVKARDDLPDLVGLTVAATAPTEVLTLECIDDAAINAERWAVKSKVAGALTAAVTGEAYDGPYIDFTIPKGTISERPIEGGIDLAATNLEGTGSPKAYPAICLYRPALGANASAKTLTLVWTARPAEDCPCESVAVTGRPDEDYLGVDLGDDDAMSNLAAGHQSRLEALISWHKTFVAGNTAVTAAGELRAADLDLQLAQLAVNELADCLTDLYGADATLTATARANSTAYTLYQVVEPATRNNYRYRCTVAGTSGSSPPTWPTTVGTTVTDGGVTWTCASKIPEIAWDDVLSGLNTDLTSLATLGAEVVPSISTLFSDAFEYQETSLSTAPVEGTSYTGVASDGTVHTYKAVSVYVVGTPSSYGLIPTHITGDLETHTGFENLATPTFGYRIIWQDLGQVNTTADMNSTENQELDPGILRDPQTWSQRYLSACNYVRALAGLLPKADAGLIPTAGSGVWSDPGDAFYWVIQGTAYLPVFNNRYYHSCKSVISQSGSGTTIEPTYEFGFAIQVGCAERLAEGDTLTIVIGDVSIQRPYHVGDTYEIPLVMGGPLAFSGGVTGTDTLTWTVYSSTAGALTAYALALAEAAYSGGGLGFTIHRGGIPFALGDSFAFAVESGGQFRWRKDAETWSADTGIADSVALSDGLSAAFTQGASPSFVASDVYTWQVLQPYSPAHVQTPHEEYWAWSADTATLTLTWDTDQTIEVIGLLRHQLAAPASAVVTLKNSGGATLATWIPTIAPGPLVTVLFTPLTTVRSLTLTVADAAGMSLGWVYAGVPLRTEHNARVQLRRVYALDRDDGVNAGGVYLGGGRGGVIQWENWLSQTELDALLALVDDCKADGDAPLVLLPNAATPADAALVRVDSDAIDISDIFDYQPLDPARRLLSLTLPLAAVIT